MENNNAGFDIKLVITNFAQGLILKSPPQRPHVLSINISHILKVFQFVQDFSCVNRKQGHQ